MCVHDVLVGIELHFGGILVTNSNYDQLYRNHSKQS